MTKLISALTSFYLSFISIQLKNFKHHQAAILNLFFRFPFIFLNLNFFHLSVLYISGQA